MWWRVVLAALGVLYEVLVCDACGSASEPCRKSETPKGWVRRLRKAFCPRCSPL